MLFVVCLTLLVGIINGCQQPQIVPECQKCTMEQVLTVKQTAGAKDFTSDKIYNNGPCAVRIALCNASQLDVETYVTYNFKSDGTDNGSEKGDGAVNVTMFCSEDKKWMRTTNEGVTIAVDSFECSAAE